MTTAAVFALFCATAAAQQNDWMIVPGQRLGPITAQTTRANLTLLFGEGNLKDRDFDTGEGFFQPATIVIAKDPSASLAILWGDQRIDTVNVCFERLFGLCKWHTRDGVGFGTGLLKLEALNGRSFVLNDWGSDVGGIVTSWEGGKLEREFGDRRDRLLVLTMDFSTNPSYTSQQKQASREIRRLHRDPRSSDPAMRKLHPVVTRIWFRFPPAAAAIP